MRAKRLLAIVAAALLCTHSSAVRTAALDLRMPSEGMLIYSQDFDDWGATDWQDAPPIALGLRELTVAEDGVYSEGNARFSLGDGRLYFDNREGDGDSYLAFETLNDEYLYGYVPYTLQYDLCYVALRKDTGYTAIITEFSEGEKYQCYNMFALRADGRGRHQCHYKGRWVNYSYYDPETDLNPSAPADGSAGTPLVRKLLGTETIGEYRSQRFGIHPTENSTGQYFLDIPVTIRLQLDSGMGHHVYMKTDEMTDFVKVSEPSIHADGPMYSWDSYGVGLKIGAGTAGYIDNLRMWYGWGDEATVEQETYAAYRNSMRKGSKERYHY